jgi:hypothetical protein
MQMKSWIRSNAGPAKAGDIPGAKQAIDDRAAWRVVKMKMSNLSDEQCKTVIATWIKNGILEKGHYQDPAVRKPRSGLSVARRPG